MPSWKRKAADAPGEQRTRALTRAELEREKALRLGLFALERAMGAPIGEIAKKYAVSTREVESALTSAERLQFVEAYRDIVRDKLVPAALVVYEMHLRQGSLEAAKAILEGLGVLQKPGAAPASGPGAPPRE